MVVVVVAGGGLQLPSWPHASQQLAKFPAQLPLLAVHDAASFLIAHLLWPWPLGFAVQQATKPGLPQVDRAAHFLTALLQLAGRLPFLTAALAPCAMQLT